MKRRAESTVRFSEDGLTLLEFLRARFTYRDREGWIRDIADGRLFLNGRSAGPNDVLAPGDRVSYDAPEEDEPPVDVDFRILYEDRALLVVDKPGNLPVHPGGRYFHHTLWALLRSRGLEPRFIHRLDRETSGLVVAAKTPGAAANLSRQFTGGASGKTYLALARGEFPQAPPPVGDPLPDEPDAEAVIDATGWLEPDSSSPVRQKRRFVPAPANAKLPRGAERCRTLLDGLGTAGDFSLVRARLLTGRRHQIRATLLALGFPVVGDKLYGGDDGLFLRFIADDLTPEDRRFLVLSRQALHARRLTLIHPESGKSLTFTSPVPRDMANALSLMGFLHSGMIPGPFTGARPS